MFSCFALTVSEHQRMCEERLAPLLSLSESLSEEDAARLGKKDPELEVRRPSVSYVSVSVSQCVTCVCVRLGGEVPVCQHSGAQQRQVALSSEREEVQGKRS